MRRVAGKIAVNLLCVTSSRVFFFLSFGMEIFILYFLEGHFWQMASKRRIMRTQADDFATFCGCLMAQKKKRKKMERKTQRRTSLRVRENRQVYTHN